MWGGWELGLWTRALHCLSPSPQTPRPTGGSAEDSAGLFWVLDEEVRVDGSSDTVVLERLRVAFEKMGVGFEGKGSGDAESSLGLGHCLCHKRP